MDPSESLTIGEIASDQVSGDGPAGTLTPSRIYIKSPNVDYWLIFRLRNSSDKPVNRILRFDEPFAKDASIYYREGDGWRSQSAGLSTPIENRPIHNRNPIFPVDIEPNETKTIYLKLHSNYGMITISIHCDEPEAFLNWELLQTACYMFYFGATSALVAYNLFLFFALREKLYLYYVLHGSSYISWVFIYSGFDLYLGATESTHYQLNPVVILVIVFLALFTRQLLQTPINLPKIDKVLVAIAGTATALGVASYIDIRYYHYITFFAFPAYLFFMLLGIYAVMKNITLAGYYLLSMGLYFSGIIVLALLLMGLIPYNQLLRYLYMPGSLAEFTTLSLALAYRVRLLQNQNTLFQQQLIETERRTKERLERAVAERTDALRKANAELERMAKKDGLTGLANRRLLNERLRHEWKRLARENRSMAAILCDIDHFKKFNDQYGHQGGDECLIKVARTIERCLHRPSDLAGRYGGEEFLILLPNTDTAGALTTAERIRSAIEDLAIEHENSETSDRLTMSFGVAAANPHEGVTAEQLVAAADESLYRAKNQGRNQVVRS
ncbi:Response regulator [Imhoffiella purpurea]|uniref:diguanylate cyclase n=2 Tax=Imhoffiella purpurea TaxID=1249627 RepID=W9VAZ6_9GAMM|nr:Response regulator [Imhoffiella purpurea]